MVKLDMITAKLSGVREEMDARIDKTGSPIERINIIIGILMTVLFRLRKVLLAIPVVYYALKIAAYNSEHLPEYVGINLQSNGAFADFITRNTAVMGSLGLTAVCLVLMFFSKKALYPWAISLFTLIVPVVLLLSNIYPM